MESATPKRVFPVIGDIVVMLLLFLAVQLGVGFFLAMTNLLPPTISPMESVSAEQYMSEQQALGRYTAMVYPLLMVPVLVVLGLYVRLRGGKRAITIRHSASGLNPNVILGGVIWLLSAQIILDPLSAILPASDSPGVGRGVWAWISVAVFAPVLEELLCRGLLFETLNKRWGIKIAIPLSAIFFGIIHADVSTIIVAVVAGVIFGMLYERTASIFCTIIIHSINNILALSLISFGVGEMTLYQIIGGGTIYYVIYGVSVAIFIALTVEAFVHLAKERKRSEKE